MIFDVCLMGHISKDIVNTGNGEIEMTGGTVYYTAIALKNLGMNVAVITKLNDKDNSLICEFEKEQIPVFVGNSDLTTSFKNVYSNDTNKREQYTKDVARPFTIKDASQFETTLFHLGPLTKDEIPIEVIRYLSEKAEVSIDVQGFVREVEKRDGGWAKIRHVPWTEKKSALSIVSIVKANEEEARILSQQQDLREIATEISGYGPKDVIITCGSKPSLIYSGGKSVRIPAYSPGNTIPLDPTGCGDTFMAGYLYYRAKCNKINEVGKFAAMTASLKLQKRGPFRGSEKDVIDFSIATGEPLPKLPD